MSGANFTTAMRMAALAAVTELRSLPPEEVLALADFVEPVDFAPGETLMAEGDAGDCLYFLTDGRVRVQRENGALLTRVAAGGVVGESALLSGTPRSATVTAETVVTALRVWGVDFRRLVKNSPGLHSALEAVDRLRREGKTPAVAGKRHWIATALRAWEARSRAVPGWAMLMGVGLLGWFGLFFAEHFDALHLLGSPWITAALRLVIGLFIIQGACEAFVIGVERLGALLRWDGFLSGTVGSLVSTLPEFVVIAFLIRVEPLAAFVTAVVTIFNNALVFALYSFFLPKDKDGAYAMPRSLTVAGGELLIAGAAVSGVVGVMMLVFRVESMKSALGGVDLIIIGAVLLGIYGFYLRSLILHYAEGEDKEEAHPPDPHRLGHDTSVRGIAGMLVLGAIGAYCGGESIGGFADAALKNLGLPTIPTAAALALFAGVSEYVIVWKSHARGELGIALSNVFGGISQVMFLLLPCTLIMIGLGALTAASPAALPITPAATILFLLLVPLFYALHQYLELDRSLNDLDAAALTGIYALLLYFLMTAPA